MRKFARGLRSREDEFRRQRMGTPAHTSVDKARKLAWGSYWRIENISIFVGKTAGRQGRSLNFRVSTLDFMLIGCAPPAPP